MSSLPSVLPSRPVYADELRLFSERGRLSIILQGGIEKENAVEIANHCTHWRTIFPFAEIILSVSSTSLLDFVRAPNASADEPRLKPAHQDEEVTVAAVRRVVETCDTIVQAHRELPLPPLKFDEKVNNGNLQIAAAKAGLAAATGMYTLRIRNDMVFNNADFVSFYFANAGYGDPQCVAFRQRIMISSIFTLNPFTVERLPFHCSDLFHFGLTEDVRALWDVPPIPFSDATYYEAHRYAPRSNPNERQFRARLAVEQHIHFNALKKQYPRLTLRYHNDRTSAEDYLRILGTEFLICDIGVSGFQLRRWHGVLERRLTFVACIHLADWRRIVEADPDVPAQTLFKDRKREAFEVMQSEGYGPPVHAEDYLEPANDDPQPAPPEMPIGETPVFNDTPRFVENDTDEKRTRVFAESGFAALLRFSGAGGIGRKAGLWKRLRADLLLSNARRAARNQRHAIAERLYRKVLEISPHRARVWIQYGHMVKQQGDMLAAIGSYHAALQLLPADGDATLHYEAAVEHVTRGS